MRLALGHCALLEQDALGGFDFNVAHQHGTGDGGGGWTRDLRGHKGDAWCRGRRVGRRAVTRLIEGVRCCVFHSAAGLSLRGRLSRGLPTGTALSVGTHPNGVNPHRPIIIKGLVSEVGAGICPAVSVRHRNHWRLPGVSLSPVKPSWGRSLEMDPGRSDSPNPCPYTSGL